jgi:hypothetical protein
MDKRAARDATEIILLCVGVVSAVLLTVLVAFAYLEIVTAYVVLGIFWLSVMWVFAYYSLSR